MKIVLVVGLPGSGKTTYLRQRQAECVGTAVVLDDPRMPDEVTAAVQAALAQQADVLFITDPWLCLATARQQACEQLREHVLEWVFFENDSSSCEANAYRRGTHDVTGLIRQLSRQYEIPADAVVLPVYRP